MPVEQGGGGIVYANNDSCVVVSICNYGFIDKARQLASFKIMLVEAWQPVGTTNMPFVLSLSCVEWEGGIVYVNALFMLIIVIIVKR